MHAITVLAVVAAFGLVFLSLLALCAERGFRPLAGVGRLYKPLHAIERFLLMLFVGVLVALAGTKDDDGDSTNSPPARMSAPRRVLAVQPGVTISESETSLGYRVLAVRDGGEIVPPQTDAVTNTAWLLRGGRNDAFRIGMDPEPTEEDWWLNPDPQWAFPWGDSWSYGLTVFARGEFQPTVHAEYFPKPFGETGVSLVPRAKWESIADGGIESLFWHELTPSNSLVLTWQNALYGRDANAPTNFQAELFGDGSFDYRYPDRTVSYAPVFPFDWDGDGLENSVDPEPLVAGPDAHGTNAEWYNTVCSNVFEAVEGEDGVELTPRHAGVNTNAYYFVDVVAERGPAPIYFMADGPSRLGNPVVVAQAGVTNRVPLLIGATYSMAASVPIRFVESPIDINVGSCEDGSFQLEWPAGLSYVLSEGVANPVVVESARLNGSLLWEGGCCTLQSGSGVSFQCHGCGCGGCSVDMNYLYEGYVLARPGPSCGCTGSEVAGESAPYVETASGANLSLSFDKPAVIFEKAYDNSPTNHVPLRSTETVLTVRACGGLHGGTLALSTSKLARLGLVDGVRPSGPLTTNLAPYEVFEMVSTNRGALASSSLRDVEVRGEFSENGTGEMARIHAALTSYELKLEAVYTAPENSSCTNRHVYGVGELVRFKVRPFSSELIIRTELQDTGDDTGSYEAFDGSPTNGFFEVDASTDHIYRCPISRNYDPPIRLCSHSVEYAPVIELIEPSEIITPSASWGVNGGDVFAGDNRWCWPSGSIGTATLVTTNYVGPMHVSFMGIAVSEIPCSEIDMVTGIFTRFPTNFVSHTRFAGAGVAWNIGEGNFWFVDCARTRARFTESTFEGVDVAGINRWLIPIGWHRIYWSRPAPGDKYDTTDTFDYEAKGDARSRRLQLGTEAIYRQVIRIDEDGVSWVEKYGWWISRSRNCRVLLGRDGMAGEVLQERHQGGEE